MSTKRRYKMFKKIVLSMIVTSSLLLSMSASQVNEASKGELGCIKGIGDKKFQRILEYKKTHTISTIDELLGIKGIGKGIIKNIKEDVVKKACKRDKRQSTAKKSSRPKRNINAK